MNSKQEILDAIRSVSLQEDSTSNHLIIDGGSTDGTLDLIKQHVSPVLSYRSEPDNGLYDAMNKGIQLAQGEIIGFLNSDDLYYDTTVLRQVHEAFVADPEVVVVYGDLVYVQPQDVNSVVRRWKSKAFDARFFGDGHVPPHPAFFAKRQVLLDSGGFDLRFEMAADYELMFRLLEIEQRKSVYLPQVLVRMRLGGKTNQSLRNIKIGNKEIVAAWRKHGKRIPLRFWFWRYFRKLRQFF